LAKKKLPNPLEHRHLLERDLDAGEAVAYADVYIEEDRPLDAVEFLAKAGASERLSELAETAIREGNAFLLKRIFAVQGLEAGQESWQRLAEAAEANGLESYARAARRLAEVGDD
jgi:hypothetical protein